jgi:small-conductance mechanosensitive channel
MLHGDNCSRKEASLMFSRFRSRIIAIASTIAIATINTPALAQTPEVLPNLGEYTPSLFMESSGDTIATGWIWLDGRPAFRIAAKNRNTLDKRITSVQENTNRILRNYLHQEKAELNIEVRNSQGLNVIYVNDSYLMSITAIDAEIRGTDTQTLTDLLVADINQNLLQARAEREPSALSEQAKEATIALLVTIFISAGLTLWQKKLKAIVAASEVSETVSISADDQLEQGANLEAIATTNQGDPPNQSLLNESAATADVETIETNPNSQTQTTKAVHPITTALRLRHRHNLRTLKIKVLQISNISVWVAGCLYILNTFPHSRIVIPLLLKGLGTPLRIGIILVLAYLAIKLSSILVDQFCSALASGSMMRDTEDAQRLQMRLSTVSQIIKSISIISIFVVAALAALVAIGIDIAPILAGAGIIGFALSFASQNLIRDAINGFFIILEDQYAVGDVIVVQEFSGFVEYMNLRITQLRDTQGRLITVPNSEIRIVANHSSRWSQADIFVPIAYGADLNKALQIVEAVALKLANDRHWREFICEQPNVLGVDDFKEKCLLIRLWIKTQPLKQWDVSREYRRRVKIALEQAGIPIPLPQQEILLNPNVDIHGYLSAKGDRTSNQSSGNFTNGKHGNKDTSSTNGNAKFSPPDQIHATPDTSEAADSPDDR